MFISAPFGGAKKLDSLGVYHWRIEMSNVMDTHYGKLHTSKKKKKKEM